MQTPQIPILETFDAVLFDMDGVIIDGMPHHARAWQEVFKQNGLSLKEMDVYLREGEPAESAARFFLREIFPEASKDLIRKLIDEKEAFFKQHANVRPLAGAYQLLQNLRRDGKKTGLVTGTARHELEVTLPDYFLPLFDILVTGDEVAKGKPDPEPYLRALGRIAVERNKVLVVENAPLGIQSAKAAGLAVWAVQTSLNAEYLQDADRIFPNLIGLYGELYPGPFLVSQEC